MSACEVHVELTAWIVAASKDDAEKAVRAALARMIVANDEDFLAEVDSVWTTEQ